MKGRTIALLCGTAGLLSTALCQSASLDDVVRNEASAAIRWEAFWEGSETLGSNYVAGKNIDIRVVKTENRLYVILGPIHLVLEMFVEGAGDQVQTARIYGVSYSTNAEVAGWIFGRQGQVGANCSQNVRQATTPEVGSTIPASRPCPPTLVVLSDSTFSLSLPLLASPDAIQKKTVPADRDLLFSAVSQYMESRADVCGPIKATVPFYSDRDPRVYVLLHQGRCPRGVATFSRAPDSTWEFGQFIADSPNEQLSGLIAKIESNSAATVP